MKKGVVIGICLALVSGAIVGDLSAQTKATVQPAKPEAKRVNCEGLGGKDCHEQNAAQAWLRLVDGGDYRQSWYAGSEVIRCYYTECKWHRHLCKNRKCWGRVVSRELIDSECCTNPKHLPMGQYYWLQYNTCFACGGPVCETVALRCDCDCACGSRWRVAHYSIR